MFSLLVCLRINWIVISNNEILILLFFFTEALRISVIIVILFMH